MNPSSGDGLVDPCNEHRKATYAAIPLLTIRDTVARSAHIIDINFMPAERIYVKHNYGPRDNERECWGGILPLPPPQMMLRGKKFRLESSSHFNEQSETNV
ncbi:hypothetical protein DPMN_103638 [Dreissena polymorpha]|uniref:Uncharacterized protein n=1 Tax=Dreissena polymorpha TaxID=45954 RepID=A0A9D4H8F4_DREPO|nr:hypothetical protein DPMN_103638 [Dreissena polymorpha]